MTPALLDGLDLAARLLLQVAVEQEAAPLALAMQPPLGGDAAQVLRDLSERGLVEQGERPDLVALTPLGLSLADDVLARWEGLKADLRIALVEHLQQATGLRDASLQEALRAVDRTAFVADGAHLLAVLDLPAPTGVQEMTTSAPHALVAILQAVSPQPGDRVLVCGAKGGMTAALAAHLVGEGGRVVAIDWDGGTVAHARRALASQPQIAERVRVEQVDDVTLGLPDEGPWQCVVMNGCVPKIPRPLVEQLDGQAGRMLLFLQEPNVPGQAAYVLGTRGLEPDEALSRFVFTPIYGRWGWDALDEWAAGFGDA